MSEVEQTVGILVDPAGYAYHLNRVVGVSTRNVAFLKRKFVSRSGHELVLYPIETCTSVRYFDERPLLTIVSGVLLIGIIALILVGLVLTWGQLPRGTFIWPGLLALAGLYGVRRLLGARRHRLVFRVGDGLALSWWSSPGDFEALRPAVEQILAFARARGLLQADPGKVAR